MFSIINYYIIPSDWHVAMYLLLKKKVYTYDVTKNVTYIAYVGLI